MADNITLDAGSGGSTIRTDDDGTAHWPYTKLAFGADNTQTIVGSTASNPLPVALSDVDNAVLDTIDTAIDAINAKLVTGTVIGDVNLGATDNAVLDAIAASVAGTLTVGSHAVTNAGTFVVQVDGAALTALQLIDDAIFAEDTAAQAADKGVQVLAVRRDADTTLVGLDNDYAPLQVDANGYLKVEIFDGGDSHTIDGTVTAELSATDNAVLDAIAASVAGTLTVGSHAVTNAGTFVVQVDGAALTALQLIDDAVFAEDVAAQAADKGMQILAVRRDADTTLVGTDNDYAPLQVDANGYLKVEIFDGGGSHTVDGTVTANLSATDNAVLDDIAAKLATIDADTSTLAAGVSTEYQVDVVGALPAGTNAIGKLAANSGIDIGDVDVTSIAAGANLVGDVGLSGARTSGGTTPYKNIDVDESEDEVKGTAGQVYWIHAINTTAAPLYLKLYNATAATVVVGTTAPTLTFPVPGNADSDGAGFTLSIPNGIAFGTAITIAGTTGVADADTGAPGANALIVNMGYA